MSSFIYPIAVSAPIVRSVAIAALLGATMLASPLSAARAEQAAAPQNQAAAGATDTRATETKGETVEQRITNLHAALKITPEQGTQWNAVAQAMRENATNMDKLVAATRTTPPQNMSAVDDLKSYEKFAQAHVDGLKNLIASFEKLYATMPNAQKKGADGVFSTSRSGTAASRS
jgi:periplasmic protein CpxP/Spy